MKHLRLLFYALALSLTFTACGGSDDDDDNGGGSSGGGGNTPTGNNINANTGEGQNALVKSYVTNLEFPHLKESGNNIVIIHIANGIGMNYAVEWDADKHSQRWSCYTMHNGNSSSITNRKPKESNGEFTEYPNDPFLDSKYHFTHDPYYGSGFDHGHIFPSADRAYGYNEQANRQTFYMTNMQPQVNGFNAGVWANMEAQVRKWNNQAGTFRRDVLYIVKGGTIDNEANYGYIDASGNYINKKYIGSGDNRIPVPLYFYMAVLCKKPQEQGGGYEAAAFWIEHKNSADDKLLKYLVSIDELEQKTGIDFFCNLPDDIENSVEKTIGASFKAGLQ